MHEIIAVCTAILALGASAAPVIDTRQESSPCASLSVQVAEFTQRNRSAQLDAQEAYNCLRTIPFDSKSGVTFIQEARKHIEWQSDIDALRDPPSEAAANFGHVDLLQGLSNIEAKAQENGYTTQVDFDTDLRTLLSSANDGHLSVQGLCTDSIFNFAWNGILVSVANSSTSAPEVYDYNDIYASENSTTLPSSIKSIDGRDAVEFLDEYASQITLQDADARYNALFASNARHGNPSVLRGLFQSRLGYWTGYSTLNYTYANGTEGTWQATATLNSRQSRWNYTSGQELFNIFCAVSLSPSSAANGTTSTNTTSTTEPSTAPTQTAFSVAYPEPVVRDPYNTLAGFYLDSDANDTAVLFIPDFETSGKDVYTQLNLPNSENADFGKAATEFLTRAKADDKTRLIIDLTANGGGTTLQGFALFKLLFPETPVYMENRYRNHNFSRLLMKSLDPYTEDYDDQFTYALTRHFGWAGQVSPDQQPTNWTSYLNFTGPESSNLTAATAFVNLTSASSPGLPIEGYSNYSTTTFSEPPFAAENITILTDGFCASTCSIFVELLTTSGEISNTLVFGGRPPLAGDTISPMQLVGGVRGTEAYDWSTLSGTAQDGLDYIEQRLNESKTTLSKDEIAQYKAIMPKDPKEFPLQFQGGSVNLRNGYSNGSDVPLQFTSTEAKCRLYYTKENILKPATTWRDAADAIWGGKECAAVGNNSQSASQGQASQSSSSTNSGSVVSHTTAITLASIMSAVVSAYLAL